MSNEKQAIRDSLDLLAGFILGKERALPKLSGTPPELQKDLLRLFIQMKDRMVEEVWLQFPGEAESILEVWKGYGIERGDDKTQVL